MLETRIGVNSNPGSTQISGPSPSSKLPGPVLLSGGPGRKWEIEGVWEKA